jgi:hypothetical protein
MEDNTSTYDELSTLIKKVKDNMKSPKSKKSHSSFKVIPSARSIKEQQESTFS